jgi:aconitase A
MEYQNAGVPLVIIAGKEYGTGSSRDWAAKGTLLLGVRAVIAESFERIHRSNLVGMGVLPLEFVNGESRLTHGLTGFETYDIDGLTDELKPKTPVTVRARATDGSEKIFKAVARIDTPEEMSYYRHGGILPYVLRQRQNYLRPAGSNSSCRLTAADSSQLELLSVGRFSCEIASGAAASDNTAPSSFRFLRVKRGIEA